MSIFQLPDKILFPHPSLAEPDGLLAIGGDLSPERLLTAYCNGIFPWYSDDSPILWWSPEPRQILFPDNLIISKSLRQIIRRGNFKIKFDTSFRQVMEFCANTPRKDEDETWITDEMIDAYVKLHELGYAHSVETFLDEKLVGGLYGIAIGGAFFGESMFHHVSNASKLALYGLVQKVKKCGISIIDTQVETQHLKSLGAENICRDDFLEILATQCNKPMLWKPDSK